MTWQQSSCSGSRKSYSDWHRAVTVGNTRTLSVCCKQCCIHYGKTCKYSWIFMLVIIFSSLIRNWAGYPIEFLIALLPHTVGPEVFKELGSRLGFPSLAFPTTNQQCLVDVVRFLEQFLGTLPIVHYIIMENVQRCTQRLFTYIESRLNITRLLECKLRDCISILPHETQSKWSTNDLQDNWRVVDSFTRMRYRYASFDNIYSAIHGIGVQV